MKRPFAPEPGQRVRVAPCAYEARSWLGVFIRSYTEASTGRTIAMVDRTASAAPGIGLRSVSISRLSKG